MQKQKMVRINYYDRQYPTYIPVKERSNGMQQIIKNTLEGIIGFAIFWLILWAMTYTACVGTYHSSMCKQDLTSQIVFKLIK